MVEKQTINGKDVWIRIDPRPMQRENPNIIPTEYFTASYFTQEPAENSRGEIIKEEGEEKLFESPVAALSHIRRYLESRLS